MFANISGCGVKGNPVIFKNVPDNMQIVRNLKTAASDNSVLLEWNIYPKDFKNNYIAIEKSELGSAGNECKDCPRTFEKVGLVSVKEMRLENKKTSILSFTDKQFVLGKIYNYRLMLCDDSSVCLEGAATEINIK